ncbi:glutaredoxin domain-containing protein [Neptunomonas phycophila]
MERITIFGRPGCGFCTRAVQLCKDKNFDFLYLEIHE